MRLAQIHHILTPSHPDHGRPFTLRQLSDRADRRGDQAVELKLNPAHVQAVIDHLQKSAVMIMRGPRPIGPTQDIITVSFVRPWELDAFKGWLESQETIARLMGLAA